jgi:hypothetical protein
MDTDKQCPMPLEWHPAYADKTYLVDWLNGVGRFGKMWDIQLPVITSKLTDIGWRYRILHRQRCWGPAPYVGKPFVYMWNAAVDELGRGIAGESRIEYIPPSTDGS